MGNWVVGGMDRVMDADTYQVTREADDYFLMLIQEKKIVYDDGILYKHWRPREGWLKQPVPVLKVTGNGYITLQSYPGDKRYHSLAHRIIWQWFKGPIPEGLVINHINGNKTDNHIENLEAITLQENIQHAKETGLMNPRTGLDHPNGKLSDEDVAKILIMGASGFPQKEIAEQFGVRPNQISRILGGQRRSISLNVYQELALRTAGNHSIKDAKVNWAMGLGGEAGEVVNEVKKNVYHGHPDQPEKILDEISDVLWYCAGLLHVYGHTLEECAIHNIKKLKKRYPKGFTQERSINREN